MFLCFSNKLWTSRYADQKQLQSKVFQFGEKQLFSTDLQAHFSANLGRSFWVPRFKSIPAVSLHHSILCFLLSPAHVESGGHHGPAYTAGAVWLLTGVPSALQVDWAPDGKSLHWADISYKQQGFAFRSDSMFLPAQERFFSQWGFTPRWQLSSETAPQASQYTQSWAKINTTGAQALLLRNGNCFLSCANAPHRVI